MGTVNSTNNGNAMKTEGVSKHAGRRGPMYRQRQRAAYVVHERVHCPRARGAGRRGEEGTRRGGQAGARTQCVEHVAAGTSLSSGRRTRGAGLLRTRALVADVTASPPSMSSPPTHVVRRPPRRAPLIQHVKIPGPRLARTVALGTSRWAAGLPS